MAITECRCRCLALSVPIVRASFWFLLIDHHFDLMQAVKSSMCCRLARGAMAKGER